MKAFFEGLIEHIKNDPIEMLYSIIVFIMGVFVVFMVIMLYEVLRRWYTLARIRRQGKDFSPIINHGKPINRIQRFLLGQTGDIYDSRYLPATLLGLGFACVVTCLSVLNSKVSYPFLSFLLIIIVWVFLVISCVFWFISLKKLIQYGRVVPIFIWSIVVGVYVNIIFF